MNGTWNAWTIKQTSYATALRTFKLINSDCRHRFEKLVLLWLSAALQVGDTLFGWTQRAASQYSTKKLAKASMWRYKNINRVLSDQRQLLRRSRNFRASQPNDLNRMQSTSWLGYIFDNGHLNCRWQSTISADNYCHSRNCLWINAACAPSRNLIGRKASYYVIVTLYNISVVGTWSSNTG